MANHVVLKWELSFGPALRPIVARHCLDRPHGTHDHDFMELVIVVRGYGRHGCSAGDSDLRAGTAFLLRPGTWHFYADCDDLEIINVCFPIEVARSEWRALLSERIRSLLRSGEGLKLTQLPLETVQAFDQMEKVARTDTGAAGLMIWILDQFAAAFPGLVSPMHPGVEAAVCALEDHPNRAWTAQELAAEVGLDRAYLSRLFTQFVGTGPMAYLALLRAERAAALLRTTSLNCAEIAHEVGYTDPNLFSRRFRARFGKSPTEYRTAVRPGKT